MYNMAPEYEFLRRCEKFKATLHREIDVIKTQETADPTRYTAAVESLPKLVSHVSAIEKSSLEMCKKMPDCDTLANKQGYYGVKSIFLKMTENLRITLLTLKQTLQHNAANKKLVSQQIDKVLSTSFLVFDHDPRNKEDQRLTF